METQDNSMSKIKSILMMIALGLPYFFSNFHRYALGIIGTDIVADYGLTAEQLGILGSALLYTYAAMQIPTGLFADKVSPKKMLILSCILAAVSSVWFATSSNFTSLVLARALTGVATALVYVPAMTIIRKSYGDAVYGTMCGIMVAMGKAGNVCAATPLKFMTDIVGWKRTFVIIGGISIVIAVLAWLLITDPGANKGKKISKENINGLFSFGAISIMIWFFFVAGSRLSFQSLWASKYFTEVLFVSPDQSGLYLTMVSVGCIFGSLIFGRMSDKIGSLKALLICSGIFSLTWIVYAKADADSSVLLISLINLVLGATGAGAFTTCFACVRTFVDKNATGLATGIFNFFAFLGSALFTQFTPAIMGISKGSISDQFFLLLMFFAASTIITALVLAIANKDKMKKQ